MAKNYHIRQDNGAIITFGSPQAIKESLEMHWPAGRYDILEGPSSISRHGGPDRRWGVAIKEPSGAVGLIPDTE
jgi:hypothetical protein